MTWRLDQIWRHPIKGIGAEPLDRIDLAPDLPLPMDRAWAVLETGAEAGDGWRSCRNFLRGAKAPSLMAVSARTDGATIHLSHPHRPDIAIDPARDGAALLDWLAPLWPADRPRPAALVNAPPRGMSDAPFASVSILNLASLRALGRKLGRTLDPRRFRGNLWLEGLAPWEEFDLVGRSLVIGGAAATAAPDADTPGARLEVIEPITRCRATDANPDTGRRDADTLRALEDGWGHRDFGVCAMVRRGGAIAVGDTVAARP